MKRPKDPLSIAFLYDDTLDSSDGVAQQVKTLGSWFAAQGHNVIYLVGETKSKSYGGKPIYSLAKNIGVVFNGNKMSVPLLADSKAVAKALRDNNLDIIHVQAPYSPLLAHKVIKKAPQHTAVIATFHIFPASKFSAAGSMLLKPFIAESLKRLDTVISVSIPAANHAFESFGLRSMVIPNTVDTNFYKSAILSRRTTGKHIVFLGRLVKRKGGMQLLRAFERLHKTNTDAMLTIAGDGPQRHTLEEYVRNNGLTGCVKFTGFVQEKAKPGLLASADVACFPSLYGESFGIVLIEAMAAGAGVVIGGNNPGYESVLGAQPKMLINPEDTAAFAERLAWVIKGGPEIKRLHDWQLSEVKKYDVSSVGTNLLAVYRQAIAKRGKTRHN
ncbi:MAG TPA: glycosyltransferase family 4 protein [Candidatus Saccharimonadales bacterium]|nr:glycosyltransferase family 4 protein [Candidatus Saccharimonadales bacterium]